MRIIRTIIMIFALAAIMVSCEKDEPFTQVSAFENALHNEVNKFRETEGLTKDLVLQYVMVKEAQEHSRAWANGSITVDNFSDDLENRWHTVKDKLGPSNISNQFTLLTQITTQTAADVVAAWAADSTNRAYLLGDLTQSGPGTGTTSDGRTYITYMLCKYTNPQ